MKWSTPSATAKSTLQHRPRPRRVPEIPCLAGFGIEREGRLFVGHIAHRDERDERRKEQKHIDSKNRTRVEKCPSHPNERSEQQQRRAKCNQNESWGIRNKDHWCRRIGYRVEMWIRSEVQWLADSPANQVNMEKTRNVRPRRKTVVTLASKHHLCGVHCPTRSIPRP